MNRVDRRHSRRERGMALVMVLGVLSVVTLLIVHVMTVCEVISKEAYVCANRMVLRYEAESATDRAFWMHLVDRSLYSSRELGNEDDSRDGTSDWEPWMADRRPHQLYDTNCQAYISGIEKSLSVTNTESFKTNVDADDTEMLELVEEFLDILEDYTDENTTKQLNGKEAEDYEAEGLASMPRDGAMQFREELYWLDGWEEVVTSEITIIPPTGKSFSSQSSQTSFFSAGAQEIQRTLDLDDSELQAVLDAREAWFADATPLEDSLSADLAYEVKSHFSFTETAYVQYSASSATPDGEVQAIYQVVRECDISQKSIYADSESNAFSIWMRTTF